MWALNNDATHRWHQSSAGVRRSERRSGQAVLFIDSIGGLGQYAPPDCSSSALSTPRASAVLGASAVRKRDGETCTLEVTTMSSGLGTICFASGYRVAAEEFNIDAWLRSLRRPCVACLRSLSRMSLNMSSSPKLSRYPGNIACTYRVAAVETSSNPVSSNRFMTSRKTTQCLKWSSLSLIHI